MRLVPDLEPTTARWIFRAKTSFKGFGMPTSTGETMGKLFMTWDLNKKKRNKSHTNMLHSIRSYNFSSQNLVTKPFRNASPQNRGTAAWSGSIGQCTCRRKKVDLYEQLIGVVLAVKPNGFDSVLICFDTYCKLSSYSDLIWANPW